jgi:hypothetical protein
MKILFHTTDKSEAMNTKQALELNGIPVFIGGENSGPMLGVIIADRFTLWVYLDDQYEDAKKFIENDEHVISSAIDVEEFYQFVEDQKSRNSRFGWDFIMPALLVVGVLGFSIWASYRVWLTW